MSTVDAMYALFDSTFTLTRSHPEARDAPSVPSSLLIGLALNAVLPTANVLVKNGMDAHAVS